MQGFKRGRSFHCGNRKQFPSTSHFFSEVITRDDFTHPGDEYKYAFAVSQDPYTKTLSTDRMGVHSTYPWTQAHWAYLTALGLQDIYLHRLPKTGFLYPRELDIYIPDPALAGPYKTPCQLSPPGCLPTQTTTDWLPIPLQTHTPDPALPGPYKTCQLSPSGYLPTQTTTDWLPIPL